jgi:hypothetical protein
MERGLAPKQVIATLTERDSGRDYRQVGMVDAAGRAAAYTGKGANAWAGHVVGDGFACQGNILAGEGVVNAMAKTFRESTGPLPERLVAALAAGQAAGGDRRGRQSAALLVVRRGGGYAGFNDRMVDIRVDDNEKPIEELRRLLALHRRAFGTAPLPDAEKGLTMEPAPKAGSLATPRAAWETWVARFRAKDWEGLYAIQTKEYRAGESLADFRAGMEARADEIAAFLDRVRYAGTRIDGDRAVVALSAPGSPRPIYQSFVREDGVWRMPD